MWTWTRRDNGARDLGCLGNGSGLIRNIGIFEWKTEKVIEESEFVKSP
jgi:hypothetical protein